MNKKVQLVIIGGLLACFFAGCKKTKTEYVYASPVSFYSPKINAVRNWSGTYANYLQGTTADTSLMFTLNDSYDSVISVTIANRTETLYYIETNEIAKTITFNGSYDNSNGNYFSLYLTYYYGDNHIVYNENYYRQPYGFAITNVSSLVVHSP